ncbi:OLC1v1018940C1 [Oldenlandia corymbosa var. corymbosa]|uniref:OLC1v1018940C1 n=1 Tax=Oldenlandia corymbosa var. corymbosa TaxID=529605 RepID=A0AAV1ECV8_OLDCO|nr:OLC1v1018940C1 [Oldenlandia corymbosa var. corymbosa]
MVQFVMWQVLKLEVLICMKMWSFVYRTHSGKLNSVIIFGRHSQLPITSYILGYSLTSCLFQHETGLCKNLLQEFAQKMNYALPVYHCQKVETPGRGSSYSCTVETGGMKYIGGAAKTKKEAEIKAARTALLAIQANYSSAESSDDDSGDDDLVLTVVPFKKKEPEENTAAVKRKKKHSKKKFKKRKRAKDNRGQNKGDESLPVDDNVGPGDLNGGSVVQPSDYKVLPAEVADSICPVEDNVGSADINSGSVFKATDFVVLSAEDTDPKSHVEDNVELGDINGGSHVKATNFEVLPAEIMHSKCIAADNVRPGDINSGVVKSTDFEALPVGVENSSFPDVGVDSIPYWNWNAYSYPNINPYNHGAVGSYPCNSDDAATLICKGDFHPEPANCGGNRLVSCVEDIGEGSLDGLFEDLTP